MVLIAMAGLPGAGKSAVAEGLAEALGCAILSVDPVEAAMWRAGIARDQPTGLAAYVVVEALAGEQLRLGRDVVVDAANAVEAARTQWRRLADLMTCELRFIEVQCSDERTHRRRLEERRRGIDGFPEPSWAAVVERRAASEGWSEDRLVVDSMAPRAANLRRALEYVGRA